MIGTSKDMPEAPQAVQGAKCIVRDDGRPHRFVWVPGPQPELNVPILTRGKLTIKISDYGFQDLFDSRVDTMDAACDSPQVRVFVFSIHGVIKPGKLSFHDGAFTGNFLEFIVHIKEYGKHSVFLSLIRAAR